MHKSLIGTRKSYAKRKMAGKWLCQMIIFIYGTRFEVLLALAGGVAWVVVLFRAPVVTAIIENIWCRTNKTVCAYETTWTSEKLNCWQNKGNWIAPGSNSKKCHDHRSLSRFLWAVEESDVCIQETLILAILFLYLFLNSRDSIKLYHGTILDCLHQELVSCTAIWI